MQNKIAGNRYFSGDKPSNALNKKSKMLKKKQIQPKNAGDSPTDQKKKFDSPKKKGMKRKQEETPVKENGDTPSKKAKMGPFPGTYVLTGKKQAEPQKGGSSETEKVKVGNQGAEGTKPLNRAQRKRLASKQKKAIARQKISTLVESVQKGDTSCIPGIKAKVEALRSRGTLTQSGKRKLKKWEAILKLAGVKVEASAKPDKNAKKDLKKGPKKPDQAKSKQKPNQQNQKKLPAKKSEEQDSDEDEEDSDYDTEAVIKPTKVSLKPDQKSQKEGEDDEEDSDEDGEEAEEEEGEGSDEEEGEGSDEEEGEESDEDEDEKSNKEDDDNKKLKSKKKTNSKSDFLSLEGDEDEESDGDEEEDESGDDEAGDDDEAEEDDDEVDKDEVEAEDDEDGTPSKKPAKNVQKNKQEDSPHKGKSRYIVFVGNLPYDAQKEQIIEHFKKAGEIQDVRIPVDYNSKKPRGFAYVEYKDEESYKKAFSLQDTFINGRKINVKYTQGGKKKGEDAKREIKAKNMKFQAMRKQGQGGFKNRSQQRAGRRMQQGSK